MAKHEPKSYQIVDVSSSNKQTYCHCMEDWSDEMKEAGDRKSLWYERMKDEGLGVKLVQDEDGTLAGMVQYLPAEYSPLIGKNFYFIYCIWVHGYKKGIGNYQGQGMGQALLQAAEEDVRKRGAHGMAAWGITLPFWMKASWFKKQGYRIIQKDGMSRLLWKPFKEGASIPQWREKKDVQEFPLEEGKVQMTSIVNGICPGMNLANRRAKAVAQEFGDSVIFKEILTEDPSILEEWGTIDALFINLKEISLGPPPSKDMIRKILVKELKKSPRTGTQPSR